MKRNRICSAGLLASILVLSLLLESPSLEASTIDTRPHTQTYSYFALSGRDTAGGTFFAEGDIINSFTLEISGGINGATFTAVLMDVEGGLPSSVLWSSAEASTPMASVEFIFNPDLPISFGSEYFIGVDAGIYTSASGNFKLGFVDDVISGKKCENLNESGFSCYFSDIASKIVMTPVPIPAVSWLFGSALGLLGWMRRKVP